MKTAIAIALAAALGVGGTLGVLALLDLPKSGDEPQISTIPLGLGDESVSTVTTAASSVVATAPTTTFEVAPPSASPEQVAAAAALSAIPDAVLDPIGGRDALKVVEFEHLDSGLEGWTGSNVNFTQGLAVMGKGIFTDTTRYAAPTAFVGLVSYSDGGWFEITLDDGTWDTAGFRRWGVYGGQGDELVPNVWEGSTEVSPEMAPIPTGPADPFWVVLAVNDGSGLLGVYSDAGLETAQGVTTGLDWDVAEWTLSIQVFSGVLNIDEYYILSP